MWALRVATMAKLSIITAPDPRLKLVCEPVEVVDNEMRRLMDDMLETMYAAPGIGLAAPQVGVARRVIVVDVTRPGEDSNPIKMVNPEVVWTSGETVLYEEGCLSLPEHYAEVSRPAKARIRYVDAANVAREIKAGQMLATCLLHEIDHLDGTLFVDRISKLKRDMILKKLTKSKRAEARADA